MKPEWHGRASTIRTGTSVRSSTEVFVRGFSDSDGDGTGDLRGLTARLDHLIGWASTASGCCRSWSRRCATAVRHRRLLLGPPDVRRVLEDVVELMDEAHQRGIRVMIDLVLNHTSDQHPWFQESRQDRTNPKADWYVWADDDQR